MPDLPSLTLAALKQTAARYAKVLSATPVPALFGVDNGKTVGTYVEAQFNIYIGEHFAHLPGNAALGIDFPELGVDLKVTSMKQPQSSCPFRDAKQKVYGLGYHLVVFVYDKTDDPELQAATLDIKHVIFVDSAHTADFQMTTRIHQILDNQGNVDDIDALLEERGLPGDEVSRRLLAEMIMQQPPEIGCLTISNALQWRLQYQRAINLAAVNGPDGSEDLLA